MLLLDVKDHTIVHFGDKLSKAILCVQTLSVNILRKRQL